MRSVPKLERAASNPLNCKCAVRPVARRVHAPVRTARGGVALARPTQQRGALPRTCAGAWHTLWILTAHQRARLIHHAACGQQQRLTCGAWGSGEWIERADHHGCLQGATLACNGMAAHEHGFLLCMHCGHLPVYPNLHSHSPVMGLQFPCFSQPR